MFEEKDVCFNENTSTHYAKLAIVFFNVPA